MKRSNWGSDNYRLANAYEHSKGGPKPTHKRVIKDVKCFIDQCNNTRSSSVLLCRQCYLITLEHNHKLLPKAGMARNEGFAELQLWHQNRRRTIGQ